VGTRRRQRARRRPNSADARPVVAGRNGSRKTKSRETERKERNHELPVGTGCAVQVATAVIPAPGEGEGEGGRGEEGLPTAVELGGGERRRQCRRDQRAEPGGENEGNRVGRLGQFG
jgi:hypothetical protein